MFSAQIFANSERRVISVLFTVIPEANDGGFNSTEFEYYFRNNVLSIWAPQLTEEQYNIVYNAFRWYYVNWPYLDDLDSNREAFNKVKKYMTNGTSSDERCISHSLCFLLHGCLDGCAYTMGNHYNNSFANGSCSHATQAGYKFRLV